MLQESGELIVGGLRLESRNLVRKYIQWFMLEAMRTQDNVGGMGNRKCDAVIPHAW